MTRITRGIPALGMLILLAGCASGPALNSHEQRRMGHSVQVYYVKPDDNIVLDNPPLVKAIHAGEATGLTFLFGAVGLWGYVAHTSSQSADVNSGIDANFYTFKSLHWPDRIQAAVFAALQASRLPISGPIRVVDKYPSYVDEWNYAKSSATDSVMFVVPEIHTVSTGDKVLISIEIFVLPHGSDEDNYPILDQTLDVSQKVVAVAMGKTWEEQKQLGHKLHAITEEQYFDYWFVGQPKPIVGFMDDAIPATQKELGDFLNGQDAAPVELPQLQWVVK